MSRRYSFVLETDHFQFYLEDRELGSKTDTTCLWDEVRDTRRVALMPGLLAVRTARFGGRTVINIGVQEHRPTLNLDDWDSVIECGLYLPSGEAVLLSPESDYKQCPRIQVTPGNYGVLVAFEGVTRVHDEMDMEGPDAYHLNLWGLIENDRVVHVLK